MICIVNSLIYICKKIVFISFSLRLYCKQDGEDKKRRKKWEIENFDRWKINNISSNANSMGKSIK